MKTTKRRLKAAAKAGLMKMIDEATGFKQPAKRIAKGPEPERLKITGFRKWEEAAAALVKAKKPPGGWPK